MIGSVIDRLTAIFALAFGQRGGLRRLGTGPDEILLSFIAMAFVLPAELAQKIDSWALIPGSDPLQPAQRLHALALGGIAALVSWLGFLAVAYEICRLMRREQRWPRLVVLWNWSQVVQGALALAVNLPDLLGAPAMAGEVVLVAFLLWAIWFDWEVVRESLGVPILDAILFVVVDAVISNLVPVIGDRLGQWIGA